MPVAASDLLLYYFLRLASPSVQILQLNAAECAVPESP